MQPYPPASISCPFSEKDLPPVDKFFDQTLIVWTPPNSCASATYPYVSQVLIRPNLNEYIKIYFRFDVTQEDFLEPLTQETLVFDLQEGVEFQNFQLQWKRHSYVEGPLYATNWWHPFGWLVKYEYYCNGQLVKKTQALQQCLIGLVGDYPYACQTCFKRIKDALEAPPPHYPVQLGTISAFTIKEYNDITTSPPTFTKILAGSLPIIPINSNAAFYSSNSELIIDFGQVAKEPQYRPIGSVFLPNNPFSFSNDILFYQQGSWGAIEVKPFQTWSIHRSLWEPYYVPGEHTWDHFQRTYIFQVDGCPDIPGIYYWGSFVVDYYYETEGYLSLGTCLLYYKYPHSWMELNWPTILIQRFRYYRWIIRGYKKHLFNKYRLYHFVINLPSKDYKLIHMEEGDLQDFVWEKTILIPETYAYGYPEFSKYFGSYNASTKQWIWNNFWFDYYVVEFYRKENPLIRSFYNFSCHEKIFWDNRAYEKIAQIFDIDFEQLQKQPKSICCHRLIQTNDPVIFGNSEIHSAETSNSIYSQGNLINEEGMVLSQFTKSIPLRIYAESLFDLIKTITNFSIGTNHFALEALYNAKGTLIRYEIKEGIVTGAGAGYLFYDDSPVQVNNPNPKIYKWIPFHWEEVSPQTILIMPAKGLQYPESVFICKAFNKLDFIPQSGINPFNGQSIAEWNFASLAHPYLAAISIEGSQIIANLYYYSPYSLTLIKSFPIDNYFSGFPRGSNLFDTYGGFLLHNPPLLQLYKSYDALLLLYKKFSPAFNRFEPEMVIINQGSIISYTSWSKYIPLNLAQNLNFKAIQIMGTWYWIFPLTSPLIVGPFWNL